MSSIQSQRPRSAFSVDSPSQVVMWVGLVAALSYLAAKIGGTAVMRPEAEWPLWPGNVLLVSILLLVPRRIWPLLMTAAFAAFAFFDLQSGVTIRSTALLILSDLVEALAAVSGLTYAFDELPRLDSVRALAKYAFFAMTVPPFIGAFIGALASRGTYWMSWRISFFSEALAYMTLLPAILGWVSKRGWWERESLAYRLEVGALLVSLVLVGYFTLVSPWAISAPALPVVPLLLWAALRFGPTGVSTATVILASLSIWGAINGRGPFVELGSLSKVMSLQVYLLFAGAPFMVLAALVEERKYAAQAVRESEGRFRLVANTAPVLIWMSGADKLCDYFNQSWLDFTGRPLSAELGNGWAEAVHPDDLTACLDTYTKAFDARRPFEMQYRLRRHDGEYRWVFDAAVPRFNGDGYFAGYIGSCIDVTDRKLAEEALSTVGRRLIQAHEDERNRIARELHDDINQRLALLANGVQEFEQATSPNGDPSQKKQLQALWQLTNEIATDVQHMSHQLHPSKLHYLGLAAAIRDLCNEFSLKHRIEVECVVRDLPQDLDENVSLNLFRTVQESLRNVFKHSHARHVKVELICQSSVVQLRVSDDGIGFDPQDVRNSHGLGMISMRERLRLVGGEFAIWSKPSLGTQVEGRAPATRKDLHAEQDCAAD